MSPEEKLATLRKRSGLSQEAVAESLGVSQRTVSAWEDAGPDGRPPRAPDLMRMLALYGATDEERREIDRLYETRPIRGRAEPTP